MDIVNEDLASAYDRLHKVELELKAAKDAVREAEETLQERARVEQELSAISNKIALATDELRQTLQALDYLQGQLSVSAAGAVQ